MTVRERMKKWREHFGISRAEMASRIGCSTDLLGMIENGDVTHPNIVNRIAHAYHLSELEAEELLPKCRRIHGGDYEPDRYVSQVDRSPICIPASVSFGKGCYQS